MGQKGKEREKKRHYMSAKIENVGRYDHLKHFFRNPLNQRPTCDLHAQENYCIGDKQLQKGMLNLVDEVKHFFKSFFCPLHHCALLFEPIALIGCSTKISASVHCVPGAIQGSKGFIFF